MLKLSNFERQSRLASDEVKTALTSLGTDPGVAWLDKNLVSPIWPEWGRLLYALKPRWEVIDQWIRTDKLHCLVALDALMKMADANDAFYRKVTPDLPVGATLQSMNEAFVVAIKNYEKESPRLSETVKKLRYAWPLKGRSCKKVKMPSAIKNIANVFFLGDEKIVSAWRENMAREMEPPESDTDVFCSLLEYASDEGFVSHIDWRSGFEDVIDLLQNQPHAKELALDWEPFEKFEGEIEDLFRAINCEMCKLNFEMIGIDEGSGDYCLTIQPPNAVSQLETLIRSLNNPTLKVVKFIES